MKAENLKTRKSQNPEKYRLILFINIDVKFLNKVLANQTPQYIKKWDCKIKWSLRNVKLIQYLKNEPIYNAAVIKQGAITKEEIHT